MNLFSPIAGIFIFLVVCAVPVQADYFQYTDSSGTVVMVDDESNIPAKYKKKVKSSKAGEGGSKVTSVSINRNQVRVPVRLSYRNNIVDAWLVLDTGATTTMITSALADRLGIKPESTERMMARVADGSVVPAYRTRIDYISVGPKLKHNPQIAIMPTNGSSSGFGDGLLGMNFLGDYRYHLDVNSQTIEWQ